MTWATQLGNATKSEVVAALILKSALLCAPRRLTARSEAFALIQIEFFELPVLGPDPAHRAGDRAHHHRLGLDHVALELDAAQHGAVGDAGGGEQAVAAHQILHEISPARIGDAHLQGALALLLGIEHEAALDLAADA